MRSTMTLSADEFMRRFLLHVLPRGFQRIRQFGLLANRSRAAQLERCRLLQGATAQTDASLCQDSKSLKQTVTGTSLQKCPPCRPGAMKFFSPVVPLTNYAPPHHQQASTIVVQAIDSS
jgi:hypothetical protein